VFNVNALCDKTHAKSKSRTAPSLIPCFYGQQFDLSFTMGIDATSGSDVVFGSNGDVRNSCTAGKFATLWRVGMINKEIVVQTLNCTPSQYPQILVERFPHVVERVLKLWNSSEAEAYFADLLQPNGRGGGRMDRDGFPEKAWYEIFQLKILYSKAHSKSAK
jgi:hypothetical protein